MVAELGAQLGARAAVVGYGSGRGCLPANIRKSDEGEFQWVPGGWFPGLLAGQEGQAVCLLSAMSCHLPRTSSPPGLERNPGKNVAVSQCSLLSAASAGCLGCSLYMEATQLDEIM